MNRLSASGAAFGTSHASAKPQAEEQVNVADIAVG